MTKEEREAKIQSLINFHGLSEEDAQKTVQILEEHNQILEELEAKKKLMSPSEILEYAKKIKPLRKNENGELFWLQNTAISTASCFYNNELIQKAEGLIEVARIKSYHTYGGHYGFLRPSADEAIWQCPKEILDKVCAFEFYTPSFELADIFDANLDRHVLTTIYYQGTVPQNLLDEPVKW
ncbi:MAG: hypothetical protein ACK5N8_03770 [Alphaproteobacteria bacterium]